MATLQTGDLTIPDQIFDPWVGKIQTGSVLGALADNIPMRFGEGLATSWTTDEAELVGESVDKSGSTYASSTQAIKPFKFQKTVRWSQEVMWADEDTQIGVVAQILDQIQPALSRAIDYGGIHGINPLTGAVATGIPAEYRINSTTQRVEIAGTEAPYELLDAADALVFANSYAPRDVAIDLAYAGTFTADRTSEGIKRYPDFQISTAVGNLEGHRASTSATVGAVGVAAVASNIKAIVGDFSAFRWGIQRTMGLELIQYGDPDGGGDLKRKNEVAFRAEVVYGWGIADLNAFAVIEDAV